MLDSKVVTYLLNCLKEEYPNKEDKDYIMAINGFMQYMKLIKDHPTNEVNMWSKSVDFVWHSFILNTRAYMDFCEDYFGKFVHHTPSEVKGIYHWKDDIDLRIWFMSTMTEMGYDPFYAVESYKKNDPFKYLPPIILADMMLEEKEDHIVGGELSLLCSYDYFDINIKTKLASIFSMFRTKTEYEKMLTNFNPTEYVKNINIRSSYKFSQEYISLPITDVKVSPSGVGAKKARLGKQELVKLQRRIEPSQTPL